MTLRWKGYFTGRAVAAILAAGLALAVPVRAQEAPPPASADSPWTTAVIQRLHLNEAQQVALRAYVASFVAAPPPPASLTAEQFADMPMPGRLNYLADNIARDLAVARAQAQASSAFYATLDADQRKLFDDATKPRSLGRPGVAADVVSGPAPGRPDYGLPSHTDADWLIRPTADDMARVYPSNARRHHIDGEVKLKCDADEDGYLSDCQVTAEQPAGQGFGNAALEITAYMRMRPATAYGIPRRSEVSLPVHFKME
jgi:TonB family protein